MRFPRKLRFNGKGRVWATIYRRTDGYRLYWRTKDDGKPVSRTQDFEHYSEAASAGETLVRQLAKGHLAATLTPGQAADCRTALERLQRYFESTGRKLSLSAAIGEYCEACALLPSGQSLGAFIESAAAILAGIKRKDIAEAIDDYIKAEESRTKAPPGQRPQLSPKYAYNRAIMLRRFAAALPGTALADLAKGHLDLFIGSIHTLKGKRNNGGVVSAKGRNHYRAAIRQFLAWATRKDYLRRDHRLLESDAMRPERSNTADIQLYTPTELRALLENAEGQMRAMIAIGALAGLRTQEMLRLDWADLWRVPGHIEVTSAKSKTRQRRLVPVCAALESWLRPFRDFGGPVCTLHEITWQQHFTKLCEKAGVERKPNALRHSFCSYAFALHGEIRAAQDAGHAPALLHAHYRGLATSAEAKAWFEVCHVEQSNVLPLKGAL